MHRDYLPMNAAALMDRVFDLYKATFKVQIAFSIAIGIISIMLIMVLGVALAFVVGAIVTSAAATTVYGFYDYESLILSIVIIMLVLLLPLYLVWIFLSSSGHIIISKQAFYREHIAFPIEETLSAFFRVMSAALVQVILSLPWLLLLGLVIFFAASGFVDIYDFLVAIPPLTIVLASLIFLLLYVVYSNIFALSVPVAIFEKRLFFTTITRSVQLLKGNFWKVLGIRLLWAFLVFLISYSAQSLMIIILAAIAALAGNVIEFAELWFATSSLQIYVSLIVGVLVGPMEGIMTALIYFNQKIKKDGLDIEIGLHRLSRNAL